jgi:hypothetical protein
MSVWLVGSARVDIPLLDETTRDRPVHIKEWIRRECHCVAGSCAPFLTSKCTPPCSTIHDFSSSCIQSSRSSPLKGLCCEEAACDKESHCVGLIRSTLSVQGIPTTLLSQALTLSSDSQGPTSALAPYSPIDCAANARLISRSPDLIGHPPPQSVQLLSLAHTRRSTGKTVSRLTNLGATDIWQEHTDQAHRDPPSLPPQFQLPRVNAIHRSRTFDHRCRILLLRIRILLCTHSHHRIPILSSST